MINNTRGTNNCERVGKRYKLPDIGYTNIIHLLIPSLKIKLFCFP